MSAYVTKPISTCERVSRALSALLSELHFPTRALGPITEARDLLLRAALDANEFYSTERDELTRDVVKLRADLAAAVAERDELRAAMADDISRSAYITRLTTGPDGATLGLSGDGPRVLVAAFVGMYRDCGAENYVELTLQDPANGERFAVTVQRVEGKTPNQLRREAEAERDTLRARLAAIENAPTLCWQDVHDPSDLYWRRPDPAQVDTRELIARPAKD